MYFYIVIKYYNVSHPSIKKEGYKVQGKGKKETSTYNSISNLDFEISLLLSHPKCSVLECDVKNLDHNISMSKKIWEKVLSRDFETSGVDRQFVHYDVAK